MTTMAELRELAVVNESELEHHGIKGMKWGVRHDNDGKGKAARKTKIARLDKKYEKKAFSQRKYWQTYNETVRIANKTVIPKINAKYEGKAYISNDGRYKDGTPLSDKTKKVNEKYLAEMNSAFNEILNKVADDVYGTNASGTVRIRFTRDNVYAFPECYFENITPTEEVNHAQIQKTERIKLDIKFENGLIVGVSMPDSPPDQEDSNDIEQSMTMLLDELEHHGIKGMKWGVRKSEEERAKAKQFKSDVKEMSKLAGKAKNTYNRRRRKELDRRLAQAGGPEYVEKVRKAANKRIRNGWIGAGAVTVLSQIALANPEGTYRLYKTAKDTAFKAAKYASTVKKGREFAKEFGIEDRVYINEAGKVLKNVVPNF